jgi:type II secretory pathway pseudopilin PulG
MNRKRRPRGFTLLEVTVVGGLMVLLVMVLASAWASVGKSIVDLIVRSQIAQEMDFAVAAISRDLGGSLPASTGQAPVLPQSPYWDHGSDGKTLNLFFDGHRITYALDSHTLVRRDLNLNTLAETTFTVATNVDDLAVSEDSDMLTIRLDFGCYYGADASRAKALLKRTCTLTAKKPT